MKGMLGCFCLFTALFFTAAAEASGALTNPIDGRYQPAGKKRVLALEPADDLTFLKRATLDIAGRLPYPAEAESFLADGSLDKRAVLVEALLASDGYVDRWTAFFSDLFRNQRVSLGNYRNAFQNTLRRMVAQNMSWAEMARRLLTFSGQSYEGSSAFVFWGIKGFDADFRLDFLDDQAGLIAEVMLGLQADCISCHDGANHLEQVNKGLSVMKREQFWGMAAFLSQTYFFQSPDAGRFFETQIVDLDDPNFDPGNGWFINTGGGAVSGEYLAITEPGEGMRPARGGGVVQPRFLLTGEAPQPGETRREALARMIVANRQFARNMVNRLWFHFFGEGFVEPLNGWDLGRLDSETAAQFDVEAQPRDPGLLEALVDRFIADGYNIQALIRVICNSNLYQANLANLGSHITQGVPWMSVHRIRRLEAEAAIDAIFQVYEIERGYLVGGMTDKVFSSLWSMPDSLEPNPQAILGYKGQKSAQMLARLGYETQDQFYQDQIAVVRALNALGRPNPYTERMRSNTASVQSGLLFLNGKTLYSSLFDASASPLVNRMAAGLADESRTPGSVVRVLYRRALFRDPTERELALGKAYLANVAGVDGVADLLWALFNQPEFLYR